MKLKDCVVEDATIYLMVDGHNYRLCKNSLNKYYDREIEKIHILGRTMWLFLKN